MLFFAVILLFVGLCNGIILDCTYETESGSTLGCIYYCEAKLIRFNDGQSVIGVSQNHLSGKSDSDVKLIKFNNQTLDFIPQNISKFFKNIQSVDVISSSLKVVLKDDLQQFPELRFISFYDNLLETLDGDLFTYNPKLQFVSFHKNKITNVGPNLLRSLKSLSQVHFNSNVCISQHAFNPSAILDLTRNLFIKCPPTVQMIEKIIVDGPKLQSKVDGTIDTKFNSKFNPSFDTRFEMKFEEKFSAKIRPVIEDNQAKARRLEIRVAELERMIMGRNARK
jgi:hypothetical protein